VIGSKILCHIWSVWNREKKFKKWIKGQICPTHACHRLPRSSRVSKNVYYFPTTVPQELGMQGMRPNPLANFFGQNLGKFFQNLGIE